MKQTDNDKGMFETKIKLREDLIEGKNNIKVLECFSGDGLLWTEIKRRHPDKNILILRIDQKEDKAGTYLKGDNLKFMESMDLDYFDLIDLDAYGSPFNQLEVVFRKGYKGPVVCTFIQTMNGALNKKMLNMLGYSDAMIAKCPSLFNKNGLEKMKAYLALKGVKSIRFSSQNRKNYFSFYLDN